MGSSESKYDNSNEEDDDSKTHQDIFIKDQAKYGEFDQLFSKYDIDNSHTLSDTEFRTALIHFAHVRPEFKEEIAELLNEIEISNVIKKEDFREMMLVVTGKSDTDENIIDVFRILDQNMDGSVGTEEISHVFGKIGLNLNVTQSNKLIDEADKDRDTKIDFEEFIKVMIAK